MLALKGNQETLHQAVKDYVDEQMETNFQDIGARKHVSTEKGHGRDESRIYAQMPAPKTLPGLDCWAGLMTIGVAMLTSLRNGKETSEIRCYISSLEMGVKRFAHAVRAQWGIETQLPFDSRYDLP